MSLLQHLIKFQRMSAASEYFARTSQLLADLGQQELPAIQKAAEICADSISQGGLVFLFGNGHSRMMCEEMTPRQGCFVGFVALVELALSNHADSSEPMVCARPCT